MGIWVQLGISYSNGGMNVGNVAPFQQCLAVVRLALVTLRLSFGVLAITYYSMGTLAYISGASIGLVIDLSIVLVRLNC